MPPHPGNAPIPGPAVLPSGWDYETTPRRIFTDQLTSLPLPDGAKPAWAKLIKTLQDLTKALAYHEAMSPNIDQPYGQPANRKTKVYHQWDFVGRTLSLALACDPDLPRGEKEQWEEVTGRAMYARMLMEDSTGMLDRMCPDDYGHGVQFGEEVMQVVRRLE